MSRSGCDTIREVAERQLCAGCGVCAYLDPQRFRMTDADAFGRRPETLDGNDPGRSEEDALAACPGVGLEHRFDPDDDGLLTELMPGWGPAYEVWEGYACAPDVRVAGSSGGAATALALYGIEMGGMHGVLHTRARPDDPVRNESVLSTTRAELFAATGSRYAPASPCDGLQMVEDAAAPCVFIGKPCDVAGAQAARRLRPALDDKLGITVAFFCAGTPSTQGTLDLLAKVGVPDPSRVKSLRYRGNGWPGRWTVRFDGEDGAEEERSLSYDESWGFLQRYRQWRCYICPDHTGEFADIAVGDPWYREIEPGEPGKSLLIARTQRGVAYLQAAAAAGYLVLETQDPSLLPRSQENLLWVRGRLWGQLIALRLAGAAVPRFLRFPQWRYWWSELSPLAKLQSIVGTLRRVGRKNLRGRVAISASSRPEPGRESS